MSVAPSPAVNYPPADGHPSTNEPDLTLTNIVEWTNALTDYAKPPPAVSVSLEHLAKPLKLKFITVHLI